jgi:rod shape-determining protein MreC
VDRTDKGDHWTQYDTFVGETVLSAADKLVYRCPAAGGSPKITITYKNVSHTPDMQVIEPQFVLTTEATGSSSLSIGEVGMGILTTKNYIGPMNVSFQGVRFFEVPCDEVISPIGYYATTNYTGPVSHTEAAGAGYLHTLKSGNYWTIDEAGRDLARLNAGYQGKVIENESLQRDIVRLEKMLYLPSYDKFKHEVARVCRRDINAWWQHLTIRKGKMHGIRKGYAVVYSGGVVGRIAEVGLYTSTVELVSSRNFRMATCARGDDRPLIYQGAGSLSLQTAQGEISDVPADMSASASNPITLVTSSLAGTFPDGIYVGKILSLKPEPDGIFKSGYVKLPKGLASIKEVSVLIPIADVKIR